MDDDLRDAHLTKVVSERIRMERLRLRWSQEKLAMLAGFSSQSIVSEIEAGRQSKLVTYGRIARALDMRLSDLVADVEELADP